MLELMLELFFVPLAPWLSKPLTGDKDTPVGHGTSAPDPTLSALFLDTVAHLDRESV